MSTTRSPFRTALIAALLAGLLAGVWYWSSHRPAPEAAGPAAMKGSAGRRPQPVSVALVKQQDIRVWLDALGTVTPRNLVTVRSKVDGTLLRVAFREGQTVKQGELLAEIDARPFRIALDQAKGQFARDTALLENARLDLARYQDLARRDAIPRQQLETQAALVRQFEGTLAADRSQVDNAALQLEYTRVLAPASGRIGLRQVDPGNQVRTSDAVGLASIAQVQPINVLFSLPEAHLPALNRRLMAHETVAVEAWDRDRSLHLAAGRVLTTDNQIDTATGSIRVKAEFPNRDGALFPNQFVNIRMLLETREGVTAVPVSALLRGDKGAFVYRVGVDARVAMLPVKPGPVDGEAMAVEGELKAGDKVVTDGTDKLRDGAKVEIIAPGGKSGGRGKGGKRRPE